MKTLKFEPYLVPSILSKEKTATWRLFDDKDLQKEDCVTFINKQTGEVFGTAHIVSVSIRNIGFLTDEDWCGHERFSSDKEMYKTYQGYYGKEITSDTEIKIVHFNFTKLK